MLIPTLGLVCTFLHQTSQPLNKILSFFFIDEKLSFREIKYFLEVVVAELRFHHAAGQCLYFRFGPTFP